MACTVAFMDIKSASKAHNAELKIDDRTLNTEYYEPAAIPSATASPQNTPSPYSTSPGSTRFPNGHGSTEDHGTSSFPDRCFYERSSSSSRLTGSSGVVVPGSGVTSSEPAEFVGSGRGGSSRGTPAATTTSASTPYHGDAAVSSGGGRSSSSSSSSTAPSGTASTGGRSRERTGSYRNGPYGTAASASTNAAPLDGRHSSRTPANNSWGYDSARYNSTGNNQTDTGYSTTPSDNIERRNSDQSSKKKTKSRSGSRSPSPSGSTSSRSPSRSRSRSSSSSSSSSLSRDTSSTGSPKSKRLTSSSISNSNHQPVVHSDDRRPLAICVKNLPVRSSDTSLKDGLFHEYKKHGKVTWVKVVGKDAERHAIVCFKKPEDVEKALEVSYDKLFFGCKIEVAPYQGYDVEDNDLRPYEAEIDEYHPKATRTLFIGNLEKDVTASDLRKHFDQFGEIIEIDIKKQGAVSSYAFCQYSDIVSVVKAIRKMDGEHLGNNRIKLGFGKSMAYNCVWIDGINENVNEKYLKMQFEPFGVISKLHIDREKGQALIFYDQVMSAQTAVTKMRGFTLKNTKIQVDFASRECQESFFERLEKQGTILDRTVFEERREATTRTFETATTRFSRYDTPIRPRTSSYSSRSNASANQVTSLQSPGTPGSVTPRGTSSRSRARFADYYDQTLDYADRHFRSYDEYSQSSTASHEDLYDHDYGFVHDTGDPLQGIDNVVTFAPPDMRNLQKERVHLLEQLEECPSSGDELISPKKRMKLDLLDTVITSDVIIEANRDHRKVMEVRRLSDVNIKHHSRRPSIDSGKHVRHDVVYVPHSVCKRRKTAGSDSGSKIHHYDHSGSESVGGSRPGTPLCDERPENFPPTEPRRVPREREGPLTLPLPRFAAQIMNRGSVSVAGIKGQKDNILSSPPPAVTSPRISNPRPPSPIHVPPPASPPPRPPSLSSNSSDSDITPPSPSLEERIKSLDEKYEKWSGSRAISAAGGDALALLDANLEKFRQRHKILDLDLKEVQPSEIVKSVMAKRSVFDEDLKRLENVGEKYEPKDFSFFPRSTLTTQTPVPVAPLPAPPALKLTTTTQIPKTPTLLSPRSTGSGIQAAKGLQYPFPTHPPILMSSPSVASPHPPTPPSSSTAPPTQLPTVTTTTVSATVVTTTSTTTPPLATPRSASHGDNRLKPCPSAPSDTRTSSKIIVNKPSVVSLTPVKISEKTNVNIPTDGKFVKSGEKSDKISCRRDSNSSNSPRDIKSRRNSDTSARRSDDSDVEQAHRERAQSEERKRERIEKIKIENDKLEKEKSERERIERERHELEKQEKLRLEKERLEKERLERESELEKQRLEKERLEKERLEKEQQEKDRVEKEKLRLERERVQKEKEVQREKERLEKEKQEQERLEKERKEKEESERRLREEQEKEQLDKERLEREKKEREEHEKKLLEEKETRDEDEKMDKPEKDKDRERERVKSKDDNHDRRKDDHRHRDTHSETKHKENHLDKQLLDSKITKDEKICSREVNHLVSTKDIHESRSSYEKIKIHIDRDTERRKESIKENRDNNIHEKHKSITDNRIRDLVETRHMSIDLDKSKIHEKLDPSKRKERNNSLPANIGSKRRYSSHETIELCEDGKKPKLSHDQKKLSERRDSKDSTRSEDKLKSSKHKNNLNKSHDKYNSSKDSEEKRKEREERHKKHKLEKQKSKSKSREKEQQEVPTIPLIDKEFLNTLELKSNEELEKQRKEKECKEKRKIIEEIDKLKAEKSPSEKSQPSAERINTKSRSDPEASSKLMDEKKKRDRIRKLTNSSDSDSDEPKKHSIFDIVVDEPAYISMYDKVKARSCKNMAKLEEEKRQEKLKAKFSQLKQSRAKREEKKRSTSWDEDSDSEKDPSEIKIKRCPKMLIDSSDDESQDRKSRKKKDIYSDSDSSAIFKHIKQEVMDTSDDESRNKNIILKALKARITSDTSEDERTRKKIQCQIKTEFCPEPSTTDFQTYNLSDDKTNLIKIKDELSKIKKERRNSKHQEPEINSLAFSDTSQPEIKTEKFNKHGFIDITSDEETHEAVKKEKSERREKKHKKKQKKQKHSVSSEESSKFENISDSLQSENPEKSKHEKKKEHSKKEKRRDKNREGREKSKKSKKNKLENKVDSKREGKMENIFGSLSEDSETGAKELVQASNLPAFNEEEAIQQQSIYNSESEKEHENKSKEKTDREREKEEHKRKKEKKRREKERRQQEAASAASLAASAASLAASAAASEQVSNENSMDYIDMGKQLEANMMQDDENVGKTTESNFVNTDNPFNLIEISESKKDKEEKREGKEKKKKRKKSKDEKSKHHNHHHHHHHHDKNKIKIPEIKKEPSLPLPEPAIEEVITAPIQPQNPSLPSIFDEQLPIKTEPVTSEPLISASPVNPSTNVLPQNPTCQEKKKDKLIPAFGTEIDEKVHETAVKSISEFDTPTIKEEIVVKEEEESKATPPPDEKPRVVISQEETEDAVAALLGESFGSVKREEFYNDNTSTEEPSNSLVEETNVQDDEEMRQAVQSLSATDLDVKPDTPQSEHDLQIDTDTEEDVPLRFDSAPKTPEAEFSHLPKTPDLPPHFANNDKQATVPTFKSTPNIGSPPSLTPIRPSNVLEVRKNLDIEKKEVISDQSQRTVISQSWTTDKKLDVPTPKSQPSVIKMETKKVVPNVSEATVQHCNLVIPATSRPYTTPPVLKIAEPQYPPLKPLSKPDHVNLSSISDIPNKGQASPIVRTSTKSPTTPQLHNLPARSPMQMNKPPLSVSDSGLLSPRLPQNLIHNRMPITSVMVSKPMQATTVILQQSKVAHSLEPPKLVSTSDPRTQDRPRMVFQTSTNQPPPFSHFGSNQSRMMIQGNIRHLPPQGLLVPARHPFNYVTHPAYNVAVSHESPMENVLDSQSKLSHPLPVSIPPNTIPCVSATHVPLPHLSIPKEVISPTPLLLSPKSMANSPSSSPFSPVCVSPLKNSPSPKPIPTAMSPKPIAAAMSPKPIPPTALSPKPMPPTAMSPKPMPPTVMSPKPMPPTVMSPKPMQPRPISPRSMPPTTMSPKPITSTVMCPIPMVPTTVSPKPISMVMSPKPVPAVIIPVPTPAAVSPIATSASISSKPTLATLSPKSISTAISPVPTLIQTPMSPKPSSTSMSPKPSATSMSPKPSATSMSPKPSATSMSPKPSATSMSPKPSATSMSPKLVSASLVTTSTSSVTSSASTLSTMSAIPTSAIICPTPTSAIVCPTPVSPKLVPVINPNLATNTTCTELGPSVSAPAKTEGMVPVPKSEQITLSADNSVIASVVPSVDLPKALEPECKQEDKPVKLAIEAVTDELNMSLEKSSPEVAENKQSPEFEKQKELIPSKPDVKTDIKLENINELKPEPLTDKLLIDNDKENNTDVKEIEKFDEEKTETESIVSDISKERSASADILAKDDPLDTKEDSDYWSAKEVNIDSVIKTLCSADELSDDHSENGKSEWFDDNKSDHSKITEKPSSDKDISPEKKPIESVVEPKSDGSEIMETVATDNSEETVDRPTLRSSNRRGGRGRGRGKQPARGPPIERGGIQTRRGKLKELSMPTPAPTKRGRGGKAARVERKSSKAEIVSSPADIYEFRDETDENKEQRPRLILTIKSPAISSSSHAQTTAIVKEVTKDGAKEIGKEHKEPPKEVPATAAAKTAPETKEEFASPSTTNTRKSRRLQEKDTSKNTVDDIIEDVVKNTVQTRSAINQRRSGRQATPKQSPPQLETPRKSPRGRKGRRGSEATETSSSEETSKEDIKVPLPQIKSPEKPKETEKPVEIEKPVEPITELVIKDKPHEGLKATVLRRIKGDFINPNTNEPTNLIDPVTGELIPMRESEEGKYIPLPGSNNTSTPKKPENISPNEPSVPSTAPTIQPKQMEIITSQPSVIAQPQQVTVVQQPKPQSLKAHVLSSQAAQAVVTQQVAPVPTKISSPSVVVTSKCTPPVTVVSKPSVPVVSPVVITKSITPIVASKTMVVTKAVTPISQHLTINTSLGVGIPTSAHLSPRPNVPINVTTKPPAKSKQLVKAPVLSPVLVTQQKQQMQHMLQAGKQTQMPKAHMTSPMATQAQMVNTQIAHMKHQPIMKQQVIMGKGPLVKSLHPQPLISGAVPSPPLSKSQSSLNNPARIIQAPSAGSKGIMDPPKVDVSMGNVMLGQRPKLSPQGSQQRIINQTGLPLPGYEPSLHAERSLLNRSRSPPPAHQNSPSPKGEAIAHFPPAPLRPPPDLNPSHYMHPSHLMQYQQYLRQQQLQQHFSRAGGLEKVGDGQEGEEAPVTSPPLELRRPGSVGLALTGRSTVVPHSLHSPHDRTTDSPQIGQVYNVHSSARIPYHNPNRYYDQAEPPPAHRPLTSHGSLAALGSDRGLAHMAPIGTPDRPLSGHSAVSAHMGGLGPTDRSMSAHIERPLSAHGLMGAGLGAAGNLMGAVARHIGADTPTSQRGLQAATPPHASQVPPQAESLLMLLKQYPCMWQGLLALKNDQAAVQMYFVSGNDDVAKCSLPKNTDGSTPPLRIFQRMRLEPPQVEGVARKMQMENEHCMLLALPCGHDHMDVLKQSTNLTNGFITYLQQKQAAGIVNVAAPGTTQPPAYVVHIFPSCDFVNRNLRRIAPSLLERVADIAHLLIVITTV